MVLYATTGTLSNATSGLIQATTNTDGIYHEGTTTSFGNAGRIVGARHGISNNGAGTLSAITNSGTISGPGGAGLQLNAATTTTTLTNSGVIDGNWGVNQSAGTITTLTNSGTFSGSGGSGDGLNVGSGTIGSLVNQAGGWIGGNNMGLENSANGTIGSIDNVGTITGWWGLYSPGALGSFVNRSTGIVFSNGNEAFATGQPLTSFMNEAGGQIQATGYVAVSFQNLTSGTNAGTIDGSLYGIQLYSGTVQNFTNTGLVKGGSRGLNQDYSTIGVFTNSGTVEGGGFGMALNATTGTISNLTGGRIAATNGDGVYVSGNVASLSNAGTIAGGTGSGDAGVQLAGSGTVATLTNDGNITGFRGVELLDSSGIGSLVNSGTISGVTSGVYNVGSNPVTSLVNQAGGLISGGGNAGIEGSRYETIDNAGTIEGASYGVNLVSTGSVTTFTNRSGGVVRGISSQGFYASRPVGTLANEAGGLIESNGSHAIRQASDSLTTLDNAGVIRTTAAFPAIFNQATITSLTNTGTISGSQGISQSGTLPTLTNGTNGLIQGSLDGVYVGRSTPMTVTNFGQITGGSRGIFGDYDLGPVTNKSGGVISGTTVAGIVIADDAVTTQPTIANEAGALITSGSGAGVKTDASSFRTRGTLVNAGVIEGATAGVDADRGGFTSIANTGTIHYSGVGTGPAIRVGSSGVLGDGTGASGPAITSTGAGARINGTIVNSGTVFHGFQIENQNVTVSADGGLGRFTSGTLNVVNGNLTFTSGTTTLDAAISVNGGTGTVFNDATLRLLGIENVTGNYQQNAGGVTLMDLLGTSSGQYGQLNATGSASFAGGLALSDAGLAGGLADGQTFQLFGFGSYTGGFGSLSVNGTSLQSLGGGDWLYGTLKLTEQWTGTTMSLAVSYSGVPEIDPASMASVLSLVIGSLGLAERRLRRRNGRTG
jgi:hypothetical protein